MKARLDISGPTLSRVVAAAGADVLRLGRARAVRYALPRALPGLPARVPVYRVDERGAATEVAHLLPVVIDGTWVERSDTTGHLHAGLPPVIVDMAPAGYLGRRFADRHPELRLPARLQDWSDDQRLVAVARRGEDMLGDLVVGEESLDRHLATPPHEVKTRAYPALAEAASTAGAGSSAAGEHPKFAAFRDGRHLLVKFSPGDGSPSDVRWRDLLVCEALSLEVLAAGGVPASRGRIVDVGSRRFLEVERFDRVGDRGRRGVLSLGPLDDDLFGARDSWTEASARLESAKLLSPEDARQMRLLDAFGLAIANGDRHFGNISFFGDGLDERPTLALAPVYDMLPMDAAPGSGVVPALVTKWPVPKAKHLDVWEEAAALGERYWKVVSKDERITSEFRRAAAVLARGRR